MPKSVARRRAVAQRIVPARRSRLRRGAGAVIAATLLAALITVPASGANAATPVSPTPAPDVVQGGGGHMQAGADGGLSTAPAATARAATTPAGSAQVKPAATPAATGASKYSVKGIDVASYQQDPNCQTPINWTQVRAAGYTFVLAKATENTTYVNPCFNDEYNGAKKAGMYAAAYAFAHPDANNPVQQADYLMQHAQFINDGKTLPLMLDLEAGGSSACWGRTPAAMAGWIRSFVNEVRAKSGKPMIVYTAAGWWNQCLSGYTGSFTDQWLDIASWTTAAGPTLPGTPTWSTWTFWQYADNGAVPGITGAVDQDVFKGTSTQLGQLAARISAVGKARPAIVSPSLGVVTVFYKGFDANLWWITYTPATGWSTAASLGDGPLGSDPVVTAQPNGNYDVFWTGTDGGLWHAWNNGATWNHEGFGSSVSGAPDVLTDGQGGVDVLWRGTDGGLWSKHYLPGKGWTANTKVGSAGQICSSPGAVETSAGALDVFWRGCNNSLYTTRRASATSTWSGGKDLRGSVAGVPAPIYAKGSTIDVLYRGTDGNLWHSYAYSPTGTWAGPYNLGNRPLGSDPAAAGKLDGTEDVLWRGTDGNIWHAWLSGGVWHHGPFAGKAQTEPSIVAQASGAMDVVFNDQSRSVGHDYFVTGAWHGPGTLGGFLS